MEYDLLGPLEVRSDGQTIAVGHGKQRALLAVLALNAGRVVSTERLIDELWGDEPPATATTALQVYVSRLRKSLGEGAIETRAPGYLVEGDVDARRFDELVSEARRSEPSRTAELLDEALGLGAGKHSPTASFPWRRPGSRSSASVLSSSGSKPTWPAAVRRSSSASWSRSSPSTRSASPSGRS